MDRLVSWTPFICSHVFAPIRLTALAIKKRQRPLDGRLTLRIGNSGSKFWVLRIQLGKKRSATRPVTE